MVFDFKKHSDELLFVPLGGSNEIGMNLNLYTIDGKWLMVDCGIGFAGDYLPGVDIVVPDISFIAEHKDNLLGLVITHAHEDHLGAVPYLWRELECPIYTTKFTAAFLKNKISEMGEGKKPKITEIECGGSIDLDPFKIEFIELTHSIAEMQALAITTKKGVVLHTGDWKFDDKPMIGSISDTQALKKYGDSKVLAMVCDSTNVYEDGYSGSEGDVREHLVSLIKQCKNRVVVSTFASNIARLTTLIHAAEETGRLVALAGRSLYRIVDAAKHAGYIREDMEFVNERDVMGLPRGDVLLICTGCQGEPRAALTRIARGDHQSIRLQPEDTVIFSSRKIPGNETKINTICNRLVSKRIEVITDHHKHDIHVSGHPARGELENMYKLVRPTIAVPTHGEPRHLHEHAKLARKLGVKETVEAHNGAVIWLEEGEASIIGEVQSGYMAVDGSSLISTDSDVIRTRRKLRDDGAVFISVVLDDNMELIELYMSFPGVLDAKEDDELIEEYNAELSDVISGIKAKASDEKIIETIRTFIRRRIKRDIDKKPVIEIALSRI
ncbi:MAG: ribonuclease J [Rickettsiales bacterium]